MAEDRISNPSKADIARWNAEGAAAKRAEFERRRAAMRGD